MTFILSPFIYTPKGYDPERKTMKAVQDAGRKARMAGQRITACPPFKDNDMTIWWQMGWRWQDEEIRQDQNFAS